MPSSETPPTHPSNANIEWADLIELDLSLFDTPEGRQQLADQLTEAIHTSGFFVVKNSGIADNKIEDQFQLCKSIFELPLDEKLPYHDAEKWARGEINGYRPIGSKLITRGNFKGKHKDNIQLYNVPKGDGVHDFTHLPLVESNIDQIQEFTKEINEKVVQKLLILVGLILKLPDENVLVKDHKSDQEVAGDEMLRYLKYNALPFEDTNEGIVAAQHVDFTAFTCSFRQPIAGLQILNKDDEWKWVRPMNDGIVVNSGDWLACVTGRYCRSGVHRVHAPPIEQSHLDRHGVIFFSRPNTDTVVQCVKDSPVLQNLGLKWAEEGIDEGMKYPDFFRAWIARLKSEQIKIHG